MYEMVVGRKEILKFFHVDRWRTIQSWKSRDEGFRKILHYNPANGKPYILVPEVLAWMLETEKLQNK